MGDNKSKGLENRVHMSAQDQSTGVNRTTVVLHWMLAASIFFLFVSSWWMLALPLPSDLFTYRELPFQLHKNVGLTVLLFAIVMFSIRIARRNREALARRSRLQKLADMDHLLLYFLLAACCLSGYLSSSYSGWETRIWWQLSVPAWTGENDALNIFFSDLHMWSCWILLAVISSHIAAALYHACRDDGMINKMFRLGPK